MPKGSPRNPSYTQSLLHRLKITSGHLQKVIAMAENDEYCIDIIHQSLAVQSALKAVDKVILEHHLKTCVAHAMQEGNVDKAVSEVMSILDKQQR